MATRVTGVRRAPILMLALGLSVTLAGCGAPAPTTPARTPAATAVPPTDPSAPISPAVAEVRAELARLLGTRNLVLDDVRIPFRPAESPALVAAPRAVFQVLLPADPNSGFISVYEFRDADEAIQAAKSQFAYLQSGPGRVQSPRGTAHLIRQVGSSVVLYSWLPEAARDPSTAAIAAVLSTLGTAFDIQT